MNFRDFPDDDHRLYLIFIHQAVSPGSLIFDSARPDFIVLDDKSSEGWTEFDRSVQVGYFETQLRASMVDISMKHPTAVFGIDYRRSSMRDWLSIILPLLTMLGITFCAFAMDREKFWKTRIEISLQSILGAVAFRFVMETMSPKVGYLMVSDKLFFLFLTVFTFLFLVSLVSPRLNTHYEKTILIFVQSIVATSCYIFWHGV